MGRAMLGDVMFDVVENEEPQYQNTITTKPVERGQDVADHVRQQPISFRITGMIAGAEAAQKLAKLRGYRNNSELLVYVGRNVIRNVVIESFQTSHTVAVRDGFTFTITLKQVRISSAQTLQLTMPDPASPSSTGSGVQTQTDPVGEQGRQQAEDQEADDDRRQSALLKLYNTGKSYLQKAGD